MVAADYVHRIGRTGRAGDDGDAISLVCVDERPLLAEIERLLGHRIEQEIVPGFAPDPTIRPQAIQLRSAGHQPQRRVNEPVALRAPVSLGRSGKAGRDAKIVSSAGIAGSLRVRVRVPQARSAARRIARTPLPGERLSRSS